MKSHVHAPLLFSIAQLHHAMKIKDHAKIRKLVADHKDQPDFFNRSSFLTWAFENEDFSHVEQILSMDDIKINETFFCDRPDTLAELFIYLFQHDKQKAAQRLLALPNININLKTKQNVPIILIAIRGKNEETLRLFLNRQDLDICAAHVKNILTETASSGTAAMLLMLLAEERFIQILNMPDPSTRTALHWACFTGEILSALHLIAMPGIDFTAEDNDGYSPLGLAAARGSMPIVSELMKLTGKTLHANDASVIKAVSAAAGNKHVDIVKLFIKARIHYSVDLLCWADENKYEDIIEMLLTDPNFNPHRLNGKDETYVNWAISNKKDKILNRLMEMPLFQIDAHEKLNQTFIVALLNFRLFLANKLYKDFSVNCNAKNSDGDSILHLWAKSHDMSDDLLRCLHEYLSEYKDANPNRSNAAGDTPLHLLARNQFGKRFLDQLYFGSVNPEYDIRNADGYTPVNLAVALGNSGIFYSLLAKAKSEVLEIPDHQGRTPLIHAILQKDVHAVSSLLEKRVRAEIADSAGRTALMYAAQAGSSEMVELLLKYNNKSVNAVDQAGDTALLLLARGHDKVGIAKLLMMHGALLITNQQGETPLAAATTARHQGMTGFLAGYVPPTLNMPQGNFDPRLMAQSVKPSAPPAEDDDNVEVYKK